MLIAPFTSLVSEEGEAFESLRAKVASFIMGEGHEDLFWKDVDRRAPEAANVGEE